MLAQNNLIEDVKIIHSFDSGGTRRVCRVRFLEQNVRSTPQCWRATVLGALTATRQFSIDDSFRVLFVPRGLRYSR